MHHTLCKILCIPIATHHHCNKRAFEGLNAADIKLYIFDEFPFDMIFYDNIDDRIMYDFLAFAVSRII